MKPKTTKTLKRIGKHGKINIEANKILKEIYFEKGIRKCELRLEGCLKNWTLAFAHKHRRYYYYDKPELLSSFNETVLACQPCHNKIDCDSKLLEAMFKKLR